MENKGDELQYCSREFLVLSSRDRGESPERIHKIEYQKAKSCRENVGDLQRITLEYAVGYKILMHTVNYED